MQQLSAAQSLSELKYHYRKLVAKHHPDRGGNVIYMQALNAKYDRLQGRFTSHKRSANDDDFSSKNTQRDNFLNLQAGEKIFINSTVSEVIKVTATAFRVVAKGRSRQAWFDINTGIGLYNEKLRASFEPIERPKKFDS
ncbi:MAG: hypothetical protein ACI89U_001368 [Gammaproteobacteria bacterium]|jgi:hypothetical protein